MSRGSRLLAKGVVGGGWRVEGGSERAKVASASRRPERVSHQPTSTRRVTSLVDPETLALLLSLFAAETGNGGCRGTPETSWHRGGRLRHGGNPLDRDFLRGKGGGNVIASCVENTRKYLECS